MLKNWCRKGRHITVTALLKNWSSAGILRWPRVNPRNMTAGAGSQGTGSRPHPGRQVQDPEGGETVVDDLIRGRVVFENSQLDDLIILRSDNTPTYNFTVVVDDVDMKITHVIRGDDHLNNTPKQIHIYKALGYEIPKFAHLPMILGADKARLSKRHGATSVMAYHEMGYLPDALVNYLVRLGWSHGDQEVFSREELVNYFSFGNVAMRQQYLIRKSFSG